MSARSQRGWAARTDVGRIRSHNEDAVLADPPLFAVADGLGGHEAGEVASHIAVETLRDHAPRRPDASALRRAVRAANREVIRAAREGIGRWGMGTTLTAALVHGTRLTIAHVGDSRAYLLHGGVLSRLTEDHSVVADLIRAGRMTEEESRSHPNRSVITRALGTDPDLKIDVYEVDASAGDRLLLCTDGLTVALLDEQIREILAANREPEAAVRALVDAANDAGGIDNVSVIVIDLSADDTAGRGVRERERALRVAVTAIGWLVAAALILSGISFLTYRYARSRAFLIAEPDGTVSLYRGVPGSIGSVELRWLERRTSVRVSELPPARQAELAEGRVFDSVDEARAFLDALETPGAR